MSQTAHTRYAHLYDSFEREEISGVRRRPTAPIVVDDPSSEPTPVHITVRTRDRARRYFVGVRFEAGVVVAEGWERAMHRDGIGSSAIAAARSWLARQAL